MSDQTLTSSGDASTASSASVTRSLASKASKTRRTLLRDARERYRRLARWIPSIEEHAAEFEADMNQWTSSSSRRGPSRTNAVMGSNEYSILLKTLDKSKMTIRCTGDDALFASAQPILESMRSELAVAFCAQDACLLDTANATTYSDLFDLVAVIQDTYRAASKSGKVTLPTASQAYATELNQAVTTFGAILKAGAENVEQRSSE